MRLVFQPKKFQIEFKTQFKNLFPRIKIISKNNRGAKWSKIELFWARFECTKSKLVFISSKYLRICRLGCLFEGYAYSLKFRNIIRSISRRF